MIPVSTLGSTSATETAATVKASGTCQFTEKSALSIDLWMKSRKREGTTDSASKTGVLEPVSQIVSRSNPGQLISEVLRSNANKPERISCFEEETNILVSIDLDSMHASDTSRAGTNECFQQ